MENIDHPLVELKRPPIYTAMKYWGKKPHNVWGSYIHNYTRPEDCVLDPFSGSSVAAFEAVKAGRKAYAFDINPLTSFCIEALCSDFDHVLFRSAVEDIINDVYSDSIYVQMYSTVCPECGKVAWIQHCKWDNSQIYEVGVKCQHCQKRFLLAPTDTMNRVAMEQECLSIPYWHPREKFRESPTFSKSFRNRVGGDIFAYLWTNRNLYVLSKIFDKILKIESPDLQLQLLFGFIQIVHLSSKMCVPRGTKSNRSFSTSWGRPAYMCARKKMEMNPLFLFEGSCMGKQSVLSAMKSVKSHIGKKPKICDLKNGPFDSNADIYYGTINVLELSKYIADNSIDFIITDPPYGGLIQYLDLSYIWTIWLQRYNVKYRPNFENEITIKDGVKSIEEFQIDFANSALEMFRVLKDNGKIVFTFNNKDVNVWRSFLLAIQSAGFAIEHVVYQPNRRTGESNVVDGDGSSANDFYIRCKKIKSTDIRYPKYNKDCEEFIVEQAQTIINNRAEPTPLNILFSGLLAKSSLQGFNLTNFDSDFESIIMRHVGKEFEIIDDKKQKLVWLVGKTIAPDKTLTHKLELLIKELAEKYPNANADLWREYIYKEYNNILTPSRESIEYIILKVQKDKNGIITR